MTTTCKSSYRKPSRQPAAEPAAEGMQPAPLQPKLRMGQVGDQYEREADSMADAVLSTGNAKRQPTASAPAVQQKPLAANVTPYVARMAQEEEPVQRMEEEEPVQRMADGPIEEQEQAIQRMPEEEQPVQQMAEEEQPVQQMTEEEQPVQGKEAQSNSTPTGFSGALSAGKSGGKPLEGSMKAQMEGGFGADFSNVRLHTDGRAQQLAQSINAKAFTHGNHIFFNRGQFNPNSREGKHLVAHELTHTIQQGAAKANAEGSAASVQRAPETVQRQQLPCPPTLAPDDPIPPGFIPYYGDPDWFHCGFRGIKEDRSPTSDALQIECFYDDKNKLVGPDHPFAGCGGTPNRWDSEGWSGILHATIDPGGIVRAGPGAFLESRVHDVVDPIVKGAEAVGEGMAAVGAGLEAMGNVMDSAAAALGDSISHALLTAMAKVDPSNWIMTGLDKSTQRELRNIGQKVTFAALFAQTGNQAFELLGKPLYEYTSESKLDEIAEGINRGLHGPNSEAVSIDGLRLGNMSVLELVDMLEADAFIGYKRSPTAIADEKMAEGSTGNQAAPAE